MNLFNWIIYLVRLALFVVLSVLFRIYLVFIFLTRTGAPVMVTAAFAAAVYWGRPYIEPYLLDVVSAWEHRPSPFDALRMFAGFVEPQPYVGTVVAAGFVLFLGLYWLQPLLRAVLLAFPMPRRPLPPLRRWSPPKHRIRAVRVTHETPNLPLRAFDGRIETLARRLRPELRALLAPKPQSAPVTVQRAAPLGQGVPTPPNPPKPAPEPSQASPKVKPAAARSRPKASTKPAQPTKPPMPKRRKADSGEHFAAE